MLIFPLYSLNITISEFQFNSLYVYGTRNTNICLCIFEHYLRGVFSNETYDGMSKHFTFLASITDDVMLGVIAGNR